MAYAGNANARRWQGYFPPKGPFPTGPTGKGPLLFKKQAPFVSNQQEFSRMADREMIAATLAAALLVRTYTGSRISAEEQAVESYRRMLIALDANQNTPRGSN